MTQRITFFVARYSLTGVPLAQIRLAKALYRSGFNVTFVVGYVPLDLELPELHGIPVINLDMPRTYRLIMPITRYMKNNSPHVIFTAEDHLNAIVAIAAILARSKAKLSASSRITPHRVYSKKPFTKKWFLRMFSLLAARRIDVLTCVSEDMVKEYEALLGISKYQCIYNVISDVDTVRKMNEPVDEPWLNDRSIPVIISAGTLSRRKGFSDLILAMKTVTKQTPARLLILGEGHLRCELEELIGKQGLVSSVRLLGFQENPLKYFGKSEVFVLSSYAEGLPNVLVEAMACGCTPVATDCPTGPREVLKGGSFGYLIPMSDSNAMAVAIQSALKHPMSSQQLLEAVEPFTEERVVAKHRSVLGI